MFKSKINKFFVEFFKLILYLILIYCIFYIISSLDFFNKTDYDGSNLYEPKSEEYKEEQLKAKKELDPLMKEIRAVMKGETNAEQDNYLARFNFSKVEYPNVTRIEAYAEFEEANLDGDEGQLIIDYRIAYHDKYGICEMKDRVNDQVISIKKVGGNWKVIEFIDSEQELH